MPKWIHSITRVVLLILAVFVSSMFCVVVVTNITDDRVIVGVIGAFTTLLSGVAGFFFGSQQPEAILEEKMMEKYDNIAKK